MNIFEYDEFHNDINKYLSDVIIEFKLSFNNDINDKFEPINNFAYLENKNIVVKLNNIDGFPYPNVTDQYYFKTEDNSLIEISDIRDFLGIDKVSFMNWYKKRTNELNGIDEFKFSERSAYLQGIVVINDTILKFYSSVMNGSINYQNYQSYQESKYII